MAKIQLTKETQNGVDIYSVFVDGIIIDHSSDMAEMELLFIKWEARLKAEKTREVIRECEI